MDPAKPSERKFYSYDHLLRHYVNFIAIYLDLSRWIFLVDCFSPNDRISRTREKAFLRLVKFSFLLLFFGETKKKDERESEKGRDREK